MTTAAEIIELLRARGLKLALAESLTGGLIATAITDVAGSSDVLIGGVVAYQNEVKTNLLGVSSDLLASRGAVCAEVAEQMASGVRRIMADACGLDSNSVIGVSTTGVAGPEPQGDKPAGLAFIAVCLEDGRILHRELQIQGNRAQVRSGVVENALSLLREQFSV